jgi:hypothetical protein
MHDDDRPRLTFRLDADTFAQVLSLAQRHDESVSQLCRDALELLLSDVGRYHRLRMSRLAQRYAPPTPAAVRYVEEYIGPDLDAICASLPLSFAPSIPDEI